MMLTVTMLGQGTFAWAAYADNNLASTISTGTGTTVGAAGQAAVAALKNFASAQAIALQGTSTSWQ